MLSLRSFEVRMDELLVKNRGVVFSNVARRGGGYTDHDKGSTKRSRRGT